MRGITPLIFLLMYDTSIQSNASILDEVKKKKIEN